MTCTIYTGYRLKGSKAILYGKCLCGAVLNDEQEIENHRNR